jgi:hypothetical protein
LINALHEEHKDRRTEPQRKKLSGLSGFLRALCVTKLP